MQPKITYASYLLRLWLVRNDTRATWIASVQSPTTGEQRSFSSVEGLIQFFQSEFGDGTSAHPDDVSRHQETEH